MKRTGLAVLPALLFLFFVPLSAIAQQPVCGSDQLRTRQADRVPESVAREALSNELVFHGVSQRMAELAPQGTISIPVVFHIMHNNGPENVSDSVIVVAVEELNLRYQNAAPYFDSTGNAVNIEFCLATEDPQGNPTTGITRTVTPYTQLVFPNDDQALKNQIRWSPDLYYNIWVVAHISGFIDGYSSFPFNAGQSIDGVVIEYYYITNSYLLAHETGHYCGLYHTFQNGCPNLNCMLNGDMVCDTPPDNSSTGFPCMTNSCTTDLQDTSGFNPFTLDMNELPNYMDYTTCPIAFSEGQAIRMETSVGTLRSSLLVSNGCGNNPGAAPPVAGFTAVVSPCNNGEVMISDSLTLNSYTSEWDFDNDGQYDTLAHQFTWVFPASGTYTIRQRVTGIGGQDTTSQVVTVFKGSTFNYPIIAYPQAVTDTIAVCEGQQYTFQGDPSGVSWLWSTGDTTASITITADSSMDISLVMTDSSGFTWSTLCTPLHMEVYPFNIPNITYDDTLGYLCQGQLVNLYISNTIPGTYTWWVYHISTGWINTGSHDTTYSIYPDPATGHTLYVTYTNAAGCTSQSAFLPLQPQWLPFLNGTPLQVNGNVLTYWTPIGSQMQWYNFDVPVPGATGNSFTVTGTGCYGVQCWFTAFPACSSATDTVCFEFTGMEDSDPYEIDVFPNPARDVLTVAWKSGNPPNRIYITGIPGNIIMEYPASSRPGSNAAFDFDIRGLASGTYFIRIEADTGVINRVWMKSGR